jgi:GrpB-like predicted nucleotidyltransferase (UPF0157 family)
MAKAIGETMIQPIKATSVEVVAYNPDWSILYKVERDAILATVSDFLVIEHIGSTAIPGQRAKPIIDMMAAVASLQTIDASLGLLSNIGYQLFDAGMRNRLFLRKEDAGTKQVFHLHIVEHATWDERKERLMRDYLLAHPETVKVYGKLKDDLAAKYTHNSLAYTKAKTEFIQSIMDKVQEARGLPHVDVWED